MKKSIALLLLFGMLCSFTACAEEDNTDNAVTTKDPNESTSESYELDKYGREIVPSALPEGLNYDGTKITILSRQATSIFDCTNEFYVEEDSGNPVDSAVFNRHRETEEELGVTLSVEVAPGDDHNTYMNLVRKSHAAGDGAYDILAFYAYHGVNMAAEGMYYNLISAPYVDLTKPWWNQNFVKEMTLLDQLYFIAGELIY